MKYCKDNTNTSTGSPYLKALVSLDTCLKVCATEAQCVSGFQYMCAGVREDAQHLNHKLSDFLDNFSQRMPIYRKEPHDVKWLDWAGKLKNRKVELTRCSNYISSMQSKVYAEEDPSSIANFPLQLEMELTETSLLLEQIDTLLNCYSSPALYEDYCRAELNSYNTTLWLPEKRKIVRETNMQTEDALLDYCNKQTKALLNELLCIKSDLATIETENVNHEAIGRYIWCNLHQEEESSDTEPTACDILRKVLAIEFFQTKANGCEEHVNDPQLIKVNMYVNQMQKYVTQEYKSKHTKLWTKILVHKDLAQRFKDVGRANFKQFCIPFVHNVICTLRNFGVYDFGGISASSLNRELKFEGKADIGDHRTSLNKEVDEDAMSVLKLIHQSVLQSA